MEREKWNITRSNFRKRAVKRVNQLFESLNDEDNSVEDNIEEDYSVEHGEIASSSDLPPNCGSESNGESELTSDEDSHVDESEDFPKDDLAGCLRNWATHFGVPLIALSALLSIPKVHHPSLPKDARTLLKTQTCTHCCFLGGWIIPLFWYTEYV